MAKRYSAKFKYQVVTELLTGAKSTAQVAKVAITKSRFPATGTGSILLGIRLSKSDCGQHSTPEKRAASGATGGAQPLVIVTTKLRRWQFDFVVVCNIIGVSVECDTIAVLIAVRYLPQKLYQ